VASARPVSIVAADDWLERLAGVLAQVAASGGAAADEWHVWVQRLAERRGLGSESAERRFVERVTDQLDFAAGEPQLLRSLAAVAQTLITIAGSTDGVIAVLQFAASAPRASAVLGKYRTGQISRTSFVAYVSSQGWPPELMRRALELDPDELACLECATANGDWRAVMELLRE
jgi:hypothetical protein